MLAISAAAISAPQKKTSPRISSVGTPADTVRSVDVVMKVIAEHIEGLQSVAELLGE